MSISPECGHKENRIKTMWRGKSSRCKPFGLTVCRFSYLAVVSGFNIYENQWSCIYAYVSSII